MIVFVSNSFLELFYYLIYLFFVYFILCFVINGNENNKINRFVGEICA
jgi:hypothetical protein